MEAGEIYACLSVFAVGCHGSEAVTCAADHNVGGTTKHQVARQFEIFNSKPLVVSIRAICLDRACYLLNEWATIRGVGPDGPAKCSSVADFKTGAGVRFGPPEIVDIGHDAACTFNQGNVRIEYPVGQFLTMQAGRTFIVHGKDPDKSKIAAEPFQFLSAPLGIGQEDIEAG